MKKLTVRQFAAVKRVAQNVNSLVEKKNKCFDKIELLRAEIEDLEKEISGHEVGIKAITDGFTSEALVVKKVENRFNSKGEEVKVTKYVPSEIVEYSEEDKCYYIKDTEPVFEETNVEEVDDSRLEEIEEKPSDEGAFDPTVFTKEDHDNIPFME